MRHEHPRPKKETADILMALALNTEHAKGECISLEDISAWHDGKLDAVTLTHVQSHVARCDHCYANWIEFQEATGIAVPAATTPRDAVRNFLHRLWPDLSQPVFATAAGAVLVSALIFGWLLPDKGQSPIYASIEQTLAVVVASGVTAATPWPWEAGWTARDLRPHWEPSSDSQRSLLAFQSGVRAALLRVDDQSVAWREIAGNLPERPSECQSGQPRCTRINELSGAIGQWALAIYLSCENAQGAVAPKEAFWDEQVSIMIAINGALADDQAETPLARFFAAWARDVDGSLDAMDQLCARNSALMSLGMSSP